MLLTPLRYVILFLIRAYQTILSPDHGPLRRLFPQGYCRFWPSCSQYAYEAVEEHGISKGLWMAIRRIGRCNPWHQAGIDEVPKRK